MTEPGTHPEIDDRLRREVAGWAPRRGPDMHDVLRRADGGWRRAVWRYSGGAALALALLLVVAVAILLMGPHLTLTDGIRERLLAH